MNGIFAGHQSASGRCADRTDIISIEEQPGVRQRIDIRCWNLTGTMKADVVPSLMKMRDGKSKYDFIKIFFYDSVEFNIFPCYNLSFRCDKFTT